MLSTKNINGSVITPKQFKAARAFLGWSQEELVKKVRVAKKIIADFEREASTLQRRGVGSGIGRRGFAKVWKLDRLEYITYLLSHIFLNKNLTKNKLILLDIQQEPHQNQQRKMHKNRS